MTARMVATIRRDLDRLPFDGGEPDVDVRLAASVGGYLRMPVFGSVKDYFDTRTAFFDGAVVDAIAAGITQVVIVGAGYDGRAFRYRSPGVTFFEVDHPATQEDKRKRLAAVGAAPSYPTFVPADLAVDDLSSALAGAGHDPTIPSLFIAEAVFPYVPEEGVRRSLAAMRSSAGPGGRLAVELALVGTDAASSAQLTMLSSFTRWLGEPVKTLLTRDAALALVHETGWTETETRQPPQHRATGRVSLFVLAT